MPTRSELAEYSKITGGGAGSPSLSAIRLSSDFWRRWLTGRPAGAAPVTAASPAITPAEHLAAQIKRIDALRAENAADHRPSFVTILAQRRTISGRPLGCLGHRCETDGTNFRTLCGQDVPAGVAVTLLCGDPEPICDACFVAIGGEIG